MDGTIYGGEGMGSSADIDRTIEHRKRTSEILVVEDSLTQAKRLERLLKGNGYGVALARDGLEGLESFPLKRL